MSKYRLILVVVALSFVGTAVEVRYLHQVAMRETWAAWIPVIISVVGLFACLFALCAEQWQRQVALGLFILTIIAGPVGFYFHTKMNFGEMTRVFRAEGDKQLMKNAKGDVDPPALAPLAISGMALIGLLAAKGAWERKDRTGLLFYGK